MKTLLLIGLIAISCIAKGQNRRKSVGIHGGPISYIIQPYGTFTHAYTAKQGGTAGLSINYPIKGKLALGVDINLSTIFYSVNYHYTAMHSADPNIPRSSWAEIQCIDLPIYLSYTIISNSKFDVFAIAGVLPSTVLTVKEEAVFEDNSIRSTEIVESSFNGLHFGAGVGYSINEELIIDLKPQLRYYLNGFDLLMGENPISYFVTFGIHYNILE